MANKRLMQAIGTLERAVGRLEQDAARLADPPASASPAGFDRSAARAALQSLDELIAAVKGGTHG